MNTSYEKVHIVKKLFLVYIGLMVLFNIVTLGQMQLPGLQILFSLIIIAFMLWMIFNISTRMKLVWWSMFLISLFGVLRPALEYLFSRMVPYVSQNFFPPFTPFFSIIGYIIMAFAFGIMTDMKIKKYFNTSERKI